ncbi:hypothetical protein [Faunimonas pinastri]|nr:hypothetical protein [Faunimonas pinastri]
MLAVVLERSVLEASDVEPLLAPLLLPFEPRMGDGTGVKGG